MRHEHGDDGHEVDLTEERFEDGAGSTQISGRTEIAVSNRQLRDEAEVEVVRARGLDGLRKKRRRTKGADRA